MARAGLPASPASSHSEVPGCRLTDRIKLAFQRRETFTLLVPQSGESVRPSAQVQPARPASGPLPQQFCAWL